MEMTKEWAMDPRDANREVKERLIDLLEALWLFLEAFFLWALYTAGPQLWAALRATWAAIVAIRWGVPRMWMQLTLYAAGDPKYNRLCEQIAEARADIAKRKIRDGEIPLSTREDAKQAIDQTFQESKRTEVITPLGLEAD